MAKKRHGRKRKKNLRLGILLGLVLLSFALVAAMILILRPASDEGEETPLSGDALWDGSWYGDDLGRIQSDRVLVRAMKAFEKRTGSKPYLSLQNGIVPEDLDAFAQEQYEALFNKGDHLLVIYDEWGENEYYLSARTGQESALSQNDLSLLLSCIEKAYADPANETYAAAFGAGFRGASEQLAPSKGSVGPAVLFALGGILMLLCLIMFVMLRRRALESRQKEAED
jgi:hypothetical protein